MSEGREREESACQSSENKRNERKVGTVESNALLGEEEGRRTALRLVDIYAFI